MWYVCGMNKAEVTRIHILESAFDMIYRNGYQATSIDKIIETTQVTKGAFFYHFKNKEEMGLAMIREVIAPRLRRLLIEPLNRSGNPLDIIQKTISNNLLKNNDFDIRYGCPINNLVQEMSPISPAFKKHLQNVLNQWKQTISDILKKGQKRGEVSKKVDTNAAAEFIIVSYEGLRGTGKVYEDIKLYQSFLKQLKLYLNALK